MTSSTELGKQDLLAMAKVDPLMLGALVNRYKFLMPKHLRKINQKLIDVVNGKCRRLIISMPPRSGKSELVSKIFPASFLGQHPDKRVILTSYEADFAASWGRKARDIMEEYGLDVFGLSVRANSSAADRWEIDGHMGGMETAGALGAITGKGAHLFIIDDPVKNSEQANSPTYRQKIFEWWTTTARTRLEPGGAVVVVMTRWHEDDLVGRLLSLMENGGEQWDVLTLPALAEENDPLDRKPGDALWPERFTRDDLLETRKAMGVVDFSALYQGRPTPKDGAIFNTEWLREYRINAGYYQLPGQSVPIVDCERFATVDLAFSDKKTADYTVCMVFDKWKEFLLIVDVVRGQWQPPEMKQKLRDAFKNYDLGHMVVEKTAAQTAVVADLASEGLPVLGVNANGSKETRAATTAVRAENGQILIPPVADWLDDFIKELSHFPKGANDDQVDALSYGAMRLPTGNERIVAPKAASGCQHVGRTRAGQSHAVRRQPIFNANNSPWATTRKVRRFNN